ncbi:MAG: hypothetical protein WCL54_04820 [Clostridia bacterium]
MDIWESLCIVPTKDVAAIKRAYEQQIRYFNKSEDPEGHQRIVKAYAKALRYAGAREAPAKPTKPAQPNTHSSFDDRKTAQTQQKKGFPVKGPFMILVIIGFLIKAITGISGMYMNSNDLNAFDTSYVYNDISSDNIYAFGDESDYSLKDYPQIDSLKGVNSSFIGRRNNIVVDDLYYQNYYVSYVVGKSGGERFKFFYRDVDATFPTNTIGQVSVAFLGDERIFFVIPYYSASPVGEEVPQTVYSGEFIKMSESLYNKLMKDVIDTGLGDQKAKIIKGVMFMFDGYDDSEWNY